MITGLYVGRPTIRSHDNVRVHLRFNPDGSLAGRTAETWAKSIARGLWGHINDKKKVRSRALPGPTWWFSCSGHGGYVMIARTDQVPTWSSHFVENGQPVWTDGQYAPNIAAYVFEEEDPGAGAEDLLPRPRIAPARGSITTMERSTMFMSGRDGAGICQNDLTSLQQMC